MTKTNIAAPAAKAAQTTAPVAAGTSSTAPTTGKVDLAKPGDKPAATAPVTAPAAAPATSAATAGQPAPATDGAAPAAPATEAPKVDIFANLPRIKLGDTSDVLDLSDVPTTNPYKYAKVAEDAAVDKLPVRRGWKHATAIFTPGTNKGPDGGFKPGSVYGTIADIVTRAGRTGIEAHALCAELRRRQIGNKRSKYCEQLPPVGWAEGWVDTAVTKNIAGIHPTKKAPAIFPKAAPAPAAEPAKPATDSKALPAPADKGKAAAPAPATKAA